MVCYTVNIHLKGQRVKNDLSKIRCEDAKWWWAVSELGPRLRWRYLFIRQDLYACLFLNPLLPFSFIMRSQAVILFQRNVAKKKKITRQLRHVVPSEWNKQKKTPNGFTRPLNIDKFSSHTVASMFGISNFHDCFRRVGDENHAAGKADFPQSFCNISITGIS